MACRRFTRALGSSDISLLKVDAEGHDLQVLRGAERTLVRKQQSPIVIFEMIHIRDELKNFFNSRYFNVTELVPAVNFAVRLENQADLRTSIPWGPWLNLRSTTT